MAIEQFHFNLQNPKLPNTLARFRKLRTTTSSNNTLDKTGAEGPDTPSFDKVDRTQTTTPGNINADIDNDNGNNATRISSFSSNSDFTSRITDSNVSSTTSIESAATTEIGLTQAISSDNSNLTNSSIAGGKVQNPLLLDLNLLPDDQKGITPSEPPSERPLGRPSPLGPTIRLSSESFSQSSSRGSLPKIENAPRSHRPSWASFWSSKYHENADALNSGNSNSPARVSQGSLPISERTFPSPGTRFDKSNPSTAVKDSEVGHQPTKTSTSKFKRFFKKLTRSQTSINQTVAAAPTPDLWHTIYDGTEDWDLLEEEDYNPFALSLPPEISSDKSELDYLRRTQEEECLELNKRRLFATKRNSKRYKMRVIE
jgi:hypothetical protein